MSVELAKRLGAEIVNADSMQIYKYMDIGTAKPDMEERQGIPHHLIDIVEPDEQFSVARYCECAKEAIDFVHTKGKPVVMVGGTGLYVDSLVNNIQFSDSLITNTYSLHNTYFLVIFINCKDYSKS